MIDVSGSFIPLQTVNEALAQDGLLNPTQAAAAEDLIEDSVGEPPSGKKPGLSHEKIGLSPNRCAHPSKRQSRSIARNKR